MADTRTHKRTYRLLRPTTTTTSESITTTTTESSSSGSSSTTTTTHGRNPNSIVIESSSKTLEKMEELKETYRYALGKSMPPWTVQEVQDALLKGVPDVYYLYALREAAAAPRPSWAYALAIVRRLQRDKVDKLTLLWKMGMGDPF